MLTSRLHDDNYPLSRRMKFSGIPFLVLFVLVLLAGRTGAAEPCAPFEGGRVDVKLLEVMRAAAKEGRLYRVMPGESRVGFCVRHFPLQEFHGEFTNIVGGLTLPPGMDKYGQALLLIHTSSLESDNPDLNALVQSHEFMDTGRFPEILFVGRAFQWYNPLQAYIYGDLTLHGVTQPVVFNVELDVRENGENGQPEQIYLHGTSQIDRVKFDMRSYQFLVSETVRLCLSVKLERWVQE